ncbi:T9SS type A sorting domain-containing protein [Taibaiella soli]|nr:T9SS type A sorting domain-containing protein [Taibaiella soli]
MKKPISYLAVSAIALFSGISAHAQYAASCLSDSINISTGIDYTTGNAYPASTSSASPVLDKYWRITGIPSNTTGLTAPTCSQMLLGSLLSTGIENNDLESRWIAVVANAYETNTTQLDPTGNFFWNCPPSTPYAPTTTPTTFTRSFYVQSTAPAEPITINLTKVWGDDYVTLYLDHTTPIYAPGFSETYGVTGPNVSFNVPPGLHTIEARLWDVSGKTTCVRFHANITAANNVLVSNTCFGITDESCNLIVPIGTDTTTGNQSSGIHHAPTSVNTVNQVPLTVYTYPNPAKDQLFVQVSDDISTAVSVLIYNANGQMVSQQEFKTMSAGQSTPVDVTSLAPGMYFMKLYSGKQELISRFAKY